MTTFSGCAAATTQQGIFAANYVVDNNVGSKVAIIHDKTPYGKGLADEFKKQLNARGLEETMYEAITAGRSGLHRADHQDEECRRST